VRDDIQRYSERQVRPFGVNPAAPEQHAAYARELRLPFVLLSDPDLAVSGAYGALRPGGAGIARSVCLIERDGTVLFSQAGAPGTPLILEGLDPG
jgi:peroxiredoxin